MKNIYFILGIHNHQPVGNFDFVLKEAFQKAYWPFLEVLTKHPNIRVCFHYSGILWEWVEEMCPQILDTFNILLERGQVELLSGGFYEPILSIIPDRDKIGQVKKMGIYINKRFGVKPKGAWLAERVWEPSIPRFMHEAGLEYVVVDDLHFLAAGLEEKDLYGYYLTDDQGKVVKVFPGSKKLRYLIPFKYPEKTIEYLKNIRQVQKGDLAIMADDGEKFGIWPGTFKWVYEQGWLDYFFSLLDENRDWLRTCTFGDYIEANSPLGQIYLPTASYSEMEEWALPINTQEVFHSLIKELNKDGFSQSCQNFVRGGLWRNFLCKYKEGNNIYNRMLQVSEKIENLEDSFLSEAGGEAAVPEWLYIAKNELWKGQCNDAYWHGLFGGLYLPHLRAALYSHLIKADNIIDRNQHSNDTWIEWAIKDMDQDGFDEIKIATDNYCLFLDPDSGGAIYEWDFRPKCFNVINSLMRRPEGYHRKILNLNSQNEPSEKHEVKSIHDIEQSSVEGLENLLIYDNYCRNSLLDHFFAPSITFDDFFFLKYQEIGDFLNKPYQFEIKRDSKNLELILSRTARIDQSGLMTLSKTLTITPGNSLIKIDYTLINNNGPPVNALFGLEFNFNLLAGNAKDRYFLLDNKVPTEPNLTGRGEHKAVEVLCLVDESLGLEIGIRASEKAGLWRFPIETASHSEAGFEKVYQSSVILFFWPLFLKEGGGRKYTLDCWIREI